MVLVAACSSSPAQPDDPAGDEPEAGITDPGDLDVDRTDWSDDRIALDDEVDAFLAGSNDLGDALSDSPDELARAAEQKAQVQQSIEERLVDMFDASGGDLDILAWSEFRIAQTFLNFGCKIDEMESPEGLTPEQQEEYRRSITELSAPLVDRSRTRFENVVNSGTDPWVDHAKWLVAELGVVRQGEPVATACSTTVDYWRTGKKPPAADPDTARGDADSPAPPSSR